MGNLTTLGINLKLFVNACQTYLSCFGDLHLIGENQVMKKIQKLYKKITLSSARFEGKLNCLMANKALLLMNCNSQQRIRRSYGVKAYITVYSILFSCESLTKSVVWLS